MNFNKVQKHRGIGTVITTLIVLIASVVLGAGVIFFGGSLFQSNTEQESIQVSNVQSWAGTTAGPADSQLAFVVKNTGGKVVSINSISLRGTTVPVSSWYYNNTQSVMTVQNTQTALKFDTDGTLTSITLPSGATTFTAATGPVSLKQGETAIFYVDVIPINIGPTDVGIAYTMNVQAGKATAVQSVSVASGS
jgi:hypothetical protein